MADKTDIAELSPYSALGLFRSILDNANAGNSAIAPQAKPATFAGANVPQGKIKVEAEDANLAKKFVSSSSDFEVSKKPEQGMDLFTWMMLLREGQSDQDSMQSDTDLVNGFATLVKTLGLEDTEVNFGGKKITLGELSNKLSSMYADPNNLPEAGYPMGILGQTRLGAGSPISAKALANAEQLADQKGVLGAIQTASRVVGIDSTYMLLKAKQESGFNPHAQAKTSSAGGLYQFLDSTWVATANKHKGLLERHMGIDVDDLSRSQLLSLKNNAMASALMGAAFAKDNMNYLNRNVDVEGFQANSGALYMAHFLGPAGAEKFFEGLARNPNASAASLFPQAASSNSSVFAGKSLSDLGQWAANKMGAPAYTIS